MGRILIANSVETALRMTAKVNVAGKLRCEVTNAETGKVTKDTGWFDNLITNTGLWQFQNAPNFGYFGQGEVAGVIAVGTGSTTPQITDTSLASLLAFATATQGSGGSYTTTGYVAASSPTPAYWYATYTYTFATGAAAGNLTEIGACPGGTTNPNGNMFSRALIVDGSGNPTTVTVLSNEILTVTYQLRYYLDTTDHAFTVNLNGSPMTGTYRMSQITTARAYTDRVDKDTVTMLTYSGAITAPTAGAPTGLLGTIANASGTPHTGNPILIGLTNDIVNSGTCYGDWQGTFGAGVGTGTIASIIFQAHMWSYQFGNFSTPIVKSAGQQLQVSVRSIWSRY